MTVEEIHNITKIDEWFLEKLVNIVNLEKETLKLVQGDGNAPMLYPPRSFKMVDTCAGEFDAETPYFYSTTSGENEAEAFLQETN